MKYFFAIILFCCMCQYSHAIDTLKLKSLKYNVGLYASMNSSGDYWGPSASVGTKFAIVNGIDIEPMFHYFIGKLVGYEKGSFHSFVLPCFIQLNMREKPARIRISVGPALQIKGGVNLPSEAWGLSSAWKPFVTGAYRISYRSRHTKKAFCIDLCGYGSHKARISESVVSKEILTQLSLGFRLFL